MAGDNFQDNVKYLTNGVLEVDGNAVQVGDGQAGAKSINFTNGFELDLAANPTANRTVNLPDGNGTLLTNINVSAGTTSNNLSAVVLSNANNVSFGLNGSTITATVTTPAETPFGISAGTQSVSTGTLVFSNSNNITFGMSGSSRVTASYNFNVSGGTTSNNLNAITFSNSNGVSFGLNGSTMTGSVATSLTNINVSAGTTSNNLSAITFSNSNGVSFGLNGSTLTGSVATSLTNINVSAGTTSNNLSAITFSNSNGVSFGLNGSTLTGSVATSLTNINISAGTTSNNLSAVTFSNSNNVSFGLNGSTVTAKANASERLSLFSCNFEIVSNWTMQNAIMSFQRMSLPLNHTLTQLMMLMDLTGNTGSSGALTVSAGVYTLAGSTASLSSSQSRQISWTSGSQTSASSLYGGQSGTRYRTLGFSVTMTPGDYLVGMWFRTTNDGTWRIFGNQRVSIVGALDGNETNIFLDGHSTSSFTTAMPASVVVTATDYNRTGLSALRQPGLIFAGSF